MANRTFTLGLDVGNYDIKTQTTITSSGYGKFSKIPYGSEEAIIFEDECYVPSIEKFPYERDKTTDEKCFILSLFGIAKEIVNTVSKKADSVEDLQKKISDIKTINLGVGLPPAHLSKDRDKLYTYYVENFKDGVDFSYYCKTDKFPKAQTYNFSISLGIVEVYPQAYAASLVAPALCKRVNDPEFLTNRYKTTGFCTIDFGGYTVDVVPIKNGKPLVEKCISLEVGVLKMYAEIEKIINREYGIILSDDYIQNVLKDLPTPLNEEVVESIKEEACNWVNNIINDIRVNDIQLDATPILFLGGTSILLKKAINSNKYIANSTHVFLPNSRANAIGYKTILEAQLKQ